MPKRCCLKKKRGASTDGRVLEEFGQLERVLADLLDGREEEGLQRQADHAAQHPAGLEEAAVAHVRVAQRLQLQQRPLLVVAVRRVDVVLAVLSAKKKKEAKRNSDMFRTVTKRFQSPPVLDRHQEQLLAPSMLLPRPLIGC